MKNKKYRLVIRLVGGLAIFAILLSAFGVVIARQSFPQTDGEIQLSGLDGPVDVTRDNMGIPHIYAASMHDLFMAQGYVHAQDRFWQMDFWRHIGSGRLSEMFGNAQVETDTFLRTLGWRQVAEQELATFDPESIAILESYAEGVNAYLADHQGTAISLEYGILKILTPGYKPEPWTPVNTLTWAKAMAWDLRGNMDEEIQRAILLKTLTPEQVAQLFPAYPADHPLIVPEMGPAAAIPSAGGSLPDLDWASVLGRFSALDALLGPSGAGIGSNSWAVSGSLTASGMPLLANDPHLGFQMPSIWYQIGLHCRPVSAACPFEVAGFSFAGVPGVVIGHNQNIAWGFTNTGPDVMDLYIEKINPDNANQYEYNGQWVDMTLRTETIAVGGGKPVSLTVRSTEHGPIISDTYGKLADFTTKAGITLPENYAISLRWTALEPSTIFQAIWGFNKSANWDDFRQAASKFNVPAQNLLYADVQGNIGYQMPGNIPIRKNGDGRLPVPGWTDEYEWTGTIPFEKLPTVFNPSKGYIVTANNAVVGADYPYLISTDWDYGFRANRIVNMIENAPGPIDIATIQKMQGDSYDTNAAMLVPLLTQLAFQPGTPNQAIALDLLKNWDTQAGMDSAPAVVFEVFWKNLLADTFNDDLPKDYQPEGGSRWIEVMRNIVKQPDSFWWDDKATTDKVERRDDIFVRAFTEAVAEIEQLQGKDSAKWNWGDLHTATFVNQTLGKSGIAPIEALFNRGPFRVNGGDAIVNATGWNATLGYSVDWLPSMRMIVDLGNLSNSVTVHTTGESGHAYHPHYIDIADLWRNIQYYPMLWDEQAITTATEAHLRLLP
ncbi:MAG: penicillin acylase family protein [Chloroflexi bacterium]|nr:penicillin acylase family protein [Chloroflexota bacterium]